MRAAVRGLLTTRPPAGVARAHASRLMCSAASGVASMLTAGASCTSSKAFSGWEPSSQALIAAL